MAPVLKTCKIRIVNELQVRSLWWEDNVCGTFGPGLPVELEGKLERNPLQTASNRGKGEVMSRELLIASGGWEDYDVNRPEAIDKAALSALALLLVAKLVAQPPKSRKGKNA